MIKEKRVQAGRGLTEIKGVYRNHLENKICPCVQEWLDCCVGNLLSFMENMRRGASHCLLLQV